MSKKSLLYLFSVLVVAVLSIGFVACGGDDDDDNGGAGGGSSNSQNVLVGTWSCTITDSCGGTEEWSFSKGGDGRFTTKYANPKCNSGSWTFTYSIIAWDPSSRTGYVRIYYADENRKTDQEFSFSGNNTLYFGGGVYTKK